MSGETTISSERRSDSLIEEDGGVGVSEEDISWLAGRDERDSAPALSRILRASLSGAGWSGAGTPPQAHHIEPGNLFPQADMISTGGN
ncbi:hypothetical protein Pla110_09690 [Polystyrenella longa]|uniref:Uncharacterized protein n=1 Tax=Polystyrenella longa TaxID=2528007 RepID=A0A518CJ53_9PLAN|nr:hypothetical protein Pla110_09690 [Polystyrenella longa]